jgi:hypothetical protein
MTRYTVVWSPQAEGRLAQLWTDAANRQAVSDAANAIDAQLAVDPLTKGNPLKEGLRTLDIPPLRVLFEVHELDRLVRVVLVRIDARLSPPLANGQGQSTG